MERLKRKVLQFWRDEEGIGILEMLLIIAVILVVAVAFRKWIIAWVNRLFEKTENNLSDTLDNNSVLLPD